jgi:hypothetical protein
MRGIPTVQNVAKSVVVMAALLTCGLIGNGCAYSGMASTPDGTVILARNSMLGANRKIFVCHVAGNDLKCVESTSSP